MNSAPLLDETQRLFFAALTEPLAGDARVRADLPPGDRDVSGAFHSAANQLLRSTPGFSASERLGLYQRQYWYRILDSLAEDFTHLKRLLGGSCFWALLERYLAAHPPADFTLRHLGAGLADFIAADPGLTLDLRRWGADLARFEYALMEVFEAANPVPPVDSDFALRAVRLASSVRLVPVMCPIGTWLHNPERRHTEMPLRRQLLVVWRNTSHCIQHTREPLPLLPLLESLRSGGPLGDILARARRLPAPQTIEAAFARWHRLGWISLA